MGTTAKLALFAAALTVFGVAVGQTQQTIGQLERRRQELKLELLRERARIIREDVDATTLKQRIEALQLELGRLVDSKPSVKRIEGELAAVDKVLAQQKKN
jgi:hypothetical protein